MSLMCDEIHAHDALAGVELYYGGALDDYDSRNLPRGSVPRSQRSGRAGTVSVGADKTEIRELQQMMSPPRSAHAPLGRTSSTSMGARSERSRSSSSWASSTSEPTSRWIFREQGRFWLETIELVKEAVGDDVRSQRGTVIDSLDGTPDGIRVDQGRRRLRRARRPSR